jgi:hypothetical protein
MQEVCEQTKISLKGSIGYMLQSLLVNPQYWVHASVIIGESTVLGTYFSHYWLDGFSSGKHFHDRIISLRGDVWTHKINLTPSLFIEVPVSSEKSGRRYTIMTEVCTQYCGFTNND